HDMDPSLFRRLGPGGAKVAIYWRYPRNARWLWQLRNTLKRNNVPQCIEVWRSQSRWTGNEEAWLSSRLGRRLPLKRTGETPHLDDRDPRQDPCAYGQGNRVERGPANSMKRRVNDCSYHPGG